MATLIPGSRIGAYPYEVEAVMTDEQRGNMSEVCVARVRASDQAEASKVILKVALTQNEEHAEIVKQTLENEVDRLRRLKHPGIVRIFPIQREGIRNLPYVANATSLAGEPPFSVMEYLTGGSLSTLIEHRRLDIGMTLEIVRSLAATLDYLHSRKQVHLDLKPDNILFRTAPQPGETPEPVLIDFGIARDIGQVGLPGFTLQYASAERVESSQRANAQGPEMMVRPHPSMDVYSLGVVLYEMLTAHLPFDGRSRRKITSSILYETPKLPSSYEPRIRPELDALVLKMLDKQPSERPTAEEVARKLEEIAIQGHYLPRYPTRAGTAAPTAWPTRTSWRKRAVVGLLILLLLCQLFFILGTHPYWESRLTWTTASLRQLFDNVRQVTLTRMIAPLLQRFGLSTTIGAAPVAPIVVTITPVLMAGATMLLTAVQSTRLALVTTTPQPPQLRRTRVADRDSSVNNSPQPPRSATATPSRRHLTPTSTPASLPHSSAVATSTPVSKLVTSTPAPTSTSLEVTPVSRGETSTEIIRDSQVTGAIQPVVPLDGEDLGKDGRQVFQWRADFIPTHDQAFELIFWRAGQDPLQDGWGVAALTQTTTVHVDLQALDDDPHLPFEPGEYYWGVRLVHITPYAKLKYLGGSNRLRFQRANGKDNNDKQNHAGSD